mmetsp:Transcript_19652/g.57556  ORF Transcript_19652/g.57556 Transcript_19652/m.57556 type:complete len:273 (-) Transcript_19652:1247-2065(-)
MRIASTSACCASIGTSDGRRRIAGLAACSAALGKPGTAGTGDGLAQNHCTKTDRRRGRSASPSSLHARRPDCGCFGGRRLTRPAASGSRARRWRRSTSRAVTTAMATARDTSTTAAVAPALRPQVTLSGSPRPVVRSSKQWGTGQVSPVATPLCTPLQVCHSRVSCIRSTSSAMYRPASAHARASTSTRPTPVAAPTTTCGPVLQPIGASHRRERRHQRAQQPPRQQSPTGRTSSSSRPATIVRAKWRTPSSNTRVGSCEKVSDHGGSASHV